MKKPSKTSAIFGGLFLAIGILWLSVILIRCEVRFFKEKKRGDDQVKVSYQKIEEKIAKKLKEGKAEEPQAFSLRKHLPRMFIMQFWLIAALEILCALLFLGAGIALLRGYPFKKRFVVAALIADMILKALIWTYQLCVLTPLSEIVESENILLMYFSPDATIESKISSVLSGSKLVQPGAFYYAGIYAVLWGLTFFIFTHPKSTD